MDRRRFLSLFGLGVAGIALEQAVPLGRVWSFPSEIVIPELSSAQSIALQLSDEDHIRTSGLFLGQLKTPFARDLVRYYWEGTRVLRSMVSINS
jgi:hypothetical protein